MGFLGFKHFIGPPKPKPSGNAKGGKKQARNRDGTYKAKAKQQASRAYNSTTSRMPTYSFWGPKRSGGGRRRRSGSSSMGMMAGAGRRRGRRRGRGMF